MYRKIVLALFVLFSCTFLMSAQDDSEWYWNQPISKIEFDGLKNVKKSELNGIISSFIDLRQGAFHKTRGTTYESDDPHPENGAGTAGNDGNGHTSNIAHAHAGSGTDAESLEGTDGLPLGLLADALRQKAEHLRQHPQLHQPGAKGEVKATAYQYHNQHIRPEQGADTVNCTVQYVHKCKTSFDWSDESI